MEGKVTENEAVGKYEPNHVVYSVQWRLEKCSQRNAPHSYQCNQEICATNQTKCIEYLDKETNLKKEKLMTLTRVSFVSSKKYSHDIKSDIQFQRFKDSISNCQRTPYKWQSNDVCIRRRSCQTVEVKYVRDWIFLFRKVKSFKKINCPCLGKHSYVCGNSNNYCSVNKESCDSIKYKKINPHIKLDPRLLGLKICSENVLAFNN